jgi:hypothetical protein
MRRGLGVEIRNSQLVEVFSEGFDYTIVPDLHPPAPLLISVGNYLC